MAFILTGCMKIRVGFDVSKDASMKQSITMLFSESMISLTGGSIDESLEELAKSFTTQYPDATVEIIREGEGEEKYGGVAVSGLNPDDFENTTVTCTKEGNVITFELPLAEMQNSIADEINLSGYGLSISQLKEYGAEMLITVNMPSKATSNMGTVEGNKVTLDLLEDGISGRLVVTCKTGLSTGVLIGIGAAAAVLILIAILASRSKKPANQA